MGFDVNQEWRILRFPHSTRERRLLETHISWVILTGDWAYKFKKPLKFDFLDYSTLELRRHFCECEVEMNRVWAPEIYDRVVAIAHYGNEYHSCDVGDSLPAGGVVVEYAVRMREFPQSALLSEQLRAGAISLDEIARLGEELALLHQRLAASSTGEQAAYEHSVGPARENFEYLCEQLRAGPDRETIEHLRAWTEDQIHVLGDVFRSRARAGHVRCCHGDLHLGNLLYWQDRFIPFDGIEFNPRLREIDTINEIAFLLMELREHGYARHANRLRNRYFEATEDYDGLRVLRYYLVYRGLVRAKIDWIRQLQTHSDRPAAFSDEGRKYLAFAEKTTAVRRLQLAITFGLSGSGKSTRAMEWVDDAAFLRLRSDVIRKRLAGQDPLSKTPPEALSQLYSQASTEATYRLLAARAEQILRAGYSVIADATFLHRRERQAFEELARRLDVDFRIVACEAPTAELERRLLARGADPSDATVQVLHRQLATVEPLSEVERRHVASHPS